MIWIGLFIKLYHEFMVLSTQVICEYKYTKQKTAPYLVLFVLAEKEGFEPSKRYQRLHDFQSCALGRSATSPIIYARGQALLTLILYHFM